MRARSSARSDSRADMIHSDFTTTSWSKYQTSSKSAAILANFSAIYFVLYLLLLSVPPPSVADFSYSYSSNFSSYSSAPFVKIQFANTLTRFTTSVLLSKMENSVSNSGISTVLSATHPLCFFDMERLPTEVQKSTTVVGI